MQSPLLNYSILVVDDEPIMRDLLRRTLTLAGCRVTVAEDGLAALQQLERSAFDVLITDIKMPRMDGLTLVREARKLDPCLPSLLITGYADGLSSNTAPEFGVVDLIVKPFKNTVIVNTVSRALLARRRAEQARKDSGA
ncbi:MAG TPA: response regulator [candidate division Zixibacteria bacterium]|nr:response regulator [candidate division Zixibacteria bacterium]